MGLSEYLFENQMFVSTGALPAASAVSAACAAPQAVVAGAAAAIPHFGIQATSPGASAVVPAVAAGALLAPEAALGAVVVTAAAGVGMMAAGVGTAAMFLSGGKLLRSPRSRAQPVQMKADGGRATGPRMQVGKAAAKDEFCFGLPGSISPIREFDPANMLADKPKEEVMRWREAELTHGRVGMLAALGFLVQEKFHPLFTADGGPAIEQIPKLPPILWFGMTLAIGIAESLRIQKGWANPYEGRQDGRVPTRSSFADGLQSLKAEYTPGDLGFDPLGLKPQDPAEFRTMQEKELSHGRLAMIAAAGFLAQETVTGTTWSQTDFGS